MATVPVDRLPTDGELLAAFIAADDAADAAREIVSRLNKFEGVPSADELVALWGFATRLGYVADALRDAVTKMMDELPTLDDDRRDRLNGLLERQAERRRAVEDA